MARILATIDAGTAVDPGAVAPLVHRKRRGGQGRHGVARRDTRAELRLLGPHGHVFLEVQQRHASAGVLLAARGVTSPAARQLVEPHVNEVRPICSYSNARQSNSHLHPRVTK